MLETGPHVRTSFTAHNARTLGDLFRLRAGRSADAPALYDKRGGRWHKTTWREFYIEATKVAAGLVELGLSRGDTVAILGATKPPWAVYDMGSQLIGAVVLGIYPKQSVDQVRYLIAHSDTRVVFVDTVAELNTVLDAVADMPEVLAIVPWHGISDADFDALSARDSRLTRAERFAGERLDEQAIERRLAEIDPDQTALLVYTSGTTGPPKGAMISHANVLAILGVQDQFLVFYQDDISLSFLPMAHVAERILAFYGRVSAGVATAYATSSATVLQELAEVQPTLFGSVPRIFEKAHAKVLAELEKKPKAVQRLFAWALSVGTRKVRLEHAGKPVPMPLRAQFAVADRLVFKRIRAAFGGRVRLFITGAAPIALSILEFFWAAGLPVYEAYGMTEATVVTHMNRPGLVRLGTVGKIIAPMEAKIAPDGEILMRGPWVFAGYHKAPEATAATVIDGWLHTGDIGDIDADGYLSITDRKKHLIITAGGKNLAPANIEKALRESDPLISQVHAHGDTRKFVSALVAPSPIETLEFGVDRDLISREELKARERELMDNPTGRSPALEKAMALVTSDPSFRSRIQASVARGNANLSNVERVKRFVILDRDFSQEHGELTPTMKLRRKAIEASYADVFDRVYSEDGFALDA